MAQDITEQATQEELADSLVGEPEEQQEQQVTDTGTEEQLAEPEEQDTAEEQAEEEADYLPNETEKVFPDEVLARYAQRYQKDEKWLADPLNKQLLIDKINSDIFLRAQQQQEQELPEFEEAEPEPEPEPTRQEPQITREQYVTQLQQAVSQKTDPEMAKMIFVGFNKAFGLSDQEIAASMQANPNGAMEFTKILSVGALNLINTFAQEIFGSNLKGWVEQAYPGFDQKFVRADAAESWDYLRNSVQDAELPAYGTRDYASQARAIGAEIAGSAERFEKMVFVGSNGQPLSPQQNLAEKQRMIAERMLSGGQQQVTPAIVAQAVKTGQRIAQRSQTRRDAGNLGSGKSNAKIAATGDDDFFADGIKEYERQHGSL
jgi:hypothetical protein